jgi:hypothetical protein
MKKYMKNAFLFLCTATIIASVVSQPVLAVNDFYSGNDILFYDENAKSPCYESTPSTVKLEKNETLEKIFQLLLNGGLNSVQVAAIMGNMYQESGFNSNLEEDNHVGYGLAQWSFGRRTELEQYASNKGVPASDVAMQIEFLLKEYNPYYKSRLSSTSFSSTTDVAQATEDWMMKFEIPRMTPVNDPAALYSNRIPAALKIYELYKDLSPNSPIATTSGCSENAIVAGNIVKTALNLAWDKPVAEGTIGKAASRDTYQKIKEQYNPSVDWTDCGGFVATVMIASGVDVNYVNVSVVSQASYVKSHPEKYQIIDPKTSELKAGDILILSNGNNQHTTIYTGNNPHSSVDASLNTRIPSVRDETSKDWMVKNGAFAARVIN